MSDQAESAFTTWYAVAYRRVLTAVGTSTRRWDLAEDATAHAFEKAWVRWSRVSVMDHAEAWVFRVALNRVKRLTRRSRHEVPVESWLSHGTTLAGESWVVLVDQIGRLPQREREVVVLRYVLELSENETAAHLGIAPGTVGRYLSDARKKLTAETARPTIAATPRSTDD